jgi:hypothetical protein
MKTGFQNSDGGNSTTVRYHVCSVCMKDKVFPAIEGLAGKPPESYETDW